MLWQGFRSKGGDDKVYVRLTPAALHLAFTRLCTPDGSFASFPVSVSLPLTPHTYLIISSWSVGETPRSLEAPAYLGSEFEQLVGQKHAI